MRNSRIYWGTAILLIGFLLLLQNLGIIRGNLWGIIWPVLIILAGIQILAGLFLRQPAGEKRELSIPLAGISEANLEIEYGAGQIHLDGRAQAGNLLSGEFFGGIRENISHAGQAVRLKLKMPDNSFVFWPFGGVTDRSWKIHLSPEIPLDIRLQSGASESVLDLNDLLVRSLRVDTDASSTSITAPARAGYTRFDLHSRAASIKISVPAGVAARIESKGAISSTNVDLARFPQSGSVYQSLDYTTAVNRIDILVESGVGSVDVK